MSTLGVAPVTLTDGLRTVTGILMRESGTHIWMRVQGQRHAFRKPKWRAASTSPASEPLWSDA